MAPISLQEAWRAAGGCKTNMETKFEVGQVWADADDMWRYTLLREMDGGRWWVDTAYAGVRENERAVTTYLLRNYCRPVTPAPYVPQVGDVVEWLHESRGYGNPGERGHVVAAGEDRNGEWLGLRVESHSLRQTLYVGRDDLRLISRSGTAAAEDEAEVNEEYNTRCPRGHRAYVGLFAVQCEYCDRVAEVERQEPESVEEWWGRPGETVWCAEEGTERWQHPLRDGAVALWRAARIEAIDAEGRR